jgi:hypothetical protein
MNSTEKGNLFEERVFKAIEIAIEKGQFPLVNKFAKLYRQKKYYSAARKSDIIIDISIECFREGATKPILYILIECKDHGRNIDADKLEALNSKREDIAFGNSKGLFITTSTLRESAFNYAAAKGIGVLRMLEEEDLMWLVERADKNLSTTKENRNAINVINAITNEHFISTYHKVYGFIDSKTYLDFESLFYDLVNES